MKSKTCIALSFFSRGHVEIAALSLSTRKIYIQCSLACVIWAVRVKLFKHTTEVESIFSPFNREFDYKYYRLSHDY